jgi:hypothetical protein
MEDRPMTTRRQFLTAGVAALPLLALAGQAARAGEPPVFAEGGAAINGYDPVAYFTEGRPVPGAEAIALDWNGASWRFASAANRDAFAADPERFAPQYGGYCAYAVANGYTARTDPDAFTVHDGKLYLNFNRRIRSRWERDIPGNVSRADANWPEVLGAG